MGNNCKKPVKRAAIAFRSTKHYLRHSTKKIKSWNKVYCTNSDWMEESPWWRVVIADWVLQCLKRWLRPARGLLLERATKKPNGQQTRQSNRPMGSIV